MGGGYETDEFEFLDVGWGSQDDLEADEKSEDFSIYEEAQISSQKKASILQEGINVHSKTPLVRTREIPRNMARFPKPVAWPMVVRFPIGQRMWVHLFMD